MKRKTAKEILAESFRELANKKAIDKITIKDIADNCGYSTATFYRQFHDKFDLIAWDYTRKIEDIMSQVGKGSDSWKKTLSDAAAFFAEEKDYLANLFLHTRGLDSFIRNMREINHSHLNAAVIKASGSERIDAITEMYIRLFVLGSVQLTCEWILGEYDVSPAELALVYENALPEPLKAYLS